MNNRITELAAKTNLFERWLRQMVQHRADERAQDCAITFLENPPQETGEPSLEESCWVPLTVSLSLDGDVSGLRDDVSDAGIGAGKSDGDAARSERYVQFAFMKRTFYMDIPNNTIWPEEARRLMAQRSGFRFLSDARFAWMSHGSWKRLVRELNPVQKEYLNADVRTAAEDMAYILFTLWRFPLDWPFYHRALVFRGRKRRPWEGQGPVD